jgi:peptidyl-prolyl cis-trans isomerase SurA
MRIWLASLLLLAADTAFAETANRIIAVVNDDVITETDLAERLEAMLEEQALPEDVDLGRVQQEVLRRLIQQRLILQEAAKLGVTVGLDEVAKEMEKMQARAGSREKLDQALAEQGLTREKLKDQLRDQMMIERVLASKVKSTINVSPQEVAAEIEAHPELAKTGDRIRASHLLVRVDDTRPEEEAKALIDRLHQELAGGGDFDAAAKQYSEDSHAGAGGDMGWVAQGELLPELDAVLFSLEPGTVSAPVKSRLGYHLLRAVERRPATSLTIMEAHAEVYMQLFERKYNEALNRWLRGLADRAYVQVLASQQDS